MNRPDPVAHDRTGRHHTEQYGFAARLEGQIFGGIAQGGAVQALVEDLIYDRETGQLITGSFNDYCMREPTISAGLNCTKTRPDGEQPSWGEGEPEKQAPADRCPAVMNAVNDALASIGGPEIEMPATPEKTWRAINTSKAE